jgi:hypothetical protein
MGDECSICLGPLRHTRTTKKLSCGHGYHGTCIDNWVESGGGTCPMCRQTFVERFRMTVVIENLQSNVRVQSNVFSQTQINSFLQLLGVTAERFNEAQFDFPEGSLEHIRTILSDFGLELDTSVFNTE